MFSLTTFLDNVVFSGINQKSFNPEGTDNRTELMMKMLGGSDKKQNYINPVLTPIASLKVATFDEAKADSTTQKAS